MLQRALAVFNSQIYWPRAACVTALSLGAVRLCGSFVLPEAA